MIRQLEFTAWLQLFQEIKLSGLAALPNRTIIMESPIQVNRSTLCKLHISMILASVIQESYPYRWYQSWT